MSNPIKITFLKKIWWIAMISDQLLSRTELKILQQSDDDKLMMDNSMADLLKWHHHLGHEPIKTIHLLAAVNVRPRHIIKAHISKCTASQYGVMTKHPWRDKTIPNKIRPTVIWSVCDCVSVDQMKLSLPRFWSSTERKID